MSIDAPRGGLQLNGLQVERDEDCSSIQGRPTSLYYFVPLVRHDPLLRHDHHVRSLVDPCFRPHTPIDLLTDGFQDLPSHTNPSRGRRVQSSRMVPFPALWRRLPP